MPGDDEDDECWEIDEADIDLLEQIGEGTTATVYMARLRGRVVAVKEISALQEEVHGSIVKAVQRELRVLSRVSHPNILNFIGVVEHSGPLRLVLEFCAGGSLFELLHNCWDIPLSWKQQRLKFLQDTSMAAAYLHGLDPPIIHRDMKSLNLMLLEPVTNQFIVPHVKLADFGLARFQEARAMTQGVGTKHWTAPEVLVGTDYTDKADVFSFAMVAYEVVCRHVPFERIDPTTVARMTRDGKRPDLTDSAIVPADVPEGLLDLMALCWEQEPQMRPSFAQIVQMLADIAARTPENYSM
mmetsp:Transcript_107707/g.286715  ORF Transcript_107707/g.286715 Transcript_107707/m.286715 type:complete len:298 (-) Transcript_107707:179-1072(-)